MHFSLFMFIDNLLNVVICKTGIANAGNTPTNIVVIKITDSFIAVESYQLTELFRSSHVT